MHQRPIRLQYADINALYLALMDKTIKCADHAHTAILKEHQAELITKFYRMLERGNLRYMLRLTSLQSLAFMQIWVGSPLPPYAYRQINQVIAHIDQASKRPKPNDITHLL